MIDYASGNATQPAATCQECGMIVNQSFHRCSHRGMLFDASGELNARREQSRCDVERKRKMLRRGKG